MSMGMRLQPPGWQDSRPNPRGKHHDEQMRVSTPIIGRGVRPWRAGRWLPSRSSPQKVNPTSKYRLASGLSVSPPSRERQILTTPRQTPAMTMALRKLQKILPEFCNTMAECRFLKCCSLLGSILLVKSTSSGRAFSPVTSFLGGPSSPSSKSSPGRSPIRAWLTGGGESLRHDSSNSLDEMNAAALLESHMEVFFLLVGAESMYTSMAHVISLHFCQVLTACYEQAVKDLQLLRFSLSDAVLMNPASDGHQIINDPETFHAASAEGLVASLLSLVSFCQARIQCIQLQSVLWHSPPQPSSAPNFAELAALFASIPPNTRLATTNDDKGQSSSLAAVETLVNVTLNEISVWSALCQTAFSVQHCQFAESILGAQSTKLKLQQLRKSVTTRGTYKLSCLELWLQDTLKSVIGIFPVVFDKALAFAKPLYGFEDDMDFSPTTNTSDDSITHYRNNTVADAFEADVVDALQKHENVGAMSIAIVIDAIRTSNVRVESGFSPFDRGTVDTGADIEAAIRKQYPAVYIRTLSSMTAPSAPNSPRSSPSGVPGGQKSPMANNGSGLSLIGRGLRRDGSRKDRLGASMSSPQTPTSNRKVFRSWSNDDSSQRSQQQLHATSPSLQKKGSKAMYALEYGSEDGPGNNNVSWPHSEWTNLATAISENAADGSSENRRDMVFYSKERMLKSPESDNRLGGHGPRLSYCQQSLYCIDSLSDSMWLVAIVKDFEQPTSGWHWQSPRHSTESVEDKLRELVSNLASMVRISDRFEAPSCRLSRDTFLERSSDEIGAGLAEELKERGLDQGQIGSEKIVLFIKNQLKVLAQSNSMAGSSLTSTSRLLRRSRRGKLLHHPGHAESAAAFFLGQELMKGLIFD